MGIHNRIPQDRKESPVNNKKPRYEGEFARRFSTNIFASIGVIGIIASAFLVVTLASDASAEYGSEFAVQQNTQTESVAPAAPSQEVQARLMILSNSSQLNGAIVIAESPVQGPLDNPSTPTTSGSNLKGAITIAPETTGGPVVVSTSN